MYLQMYRLFFCKSPRFTLELDVLQAWSCRGIRSSGSWRLLYTSMNGNSAGETPGSLSRSDASSWGYTCLYRRLWIPCKSTLGSCR